MKMSAMPSPITLRIHSSKFLGFSCAVAHLTLASTRPSRQVIWSSLGRALMLFWNGYATHLFLIQTYEMRCIVFQCSSPTPTALSMSSSKYW